MLLLCEHSHSHSCYLIIDSFFQPVLSHYLLYFSLIFNLPVFYLLCHFIIKCCVLIICYCHVLPMSLACSCPVLSCPVLVIGCVLPPQGIFYFFYIILYSQSLSPCLIPSPNIDRTNWPKRNFSRTRASPFSNLPPFAPLLIRWGIDLTGSFLSVKGEVTVKEFGQEFLITADGLNITNTALK